MTKRLVFVTSADLGQANGPALHVLNLLGALADSDDAVVLIAPEAKPVLPLDGRVEWVKVRDVRRFGLPGGFAFVMMIPALWRARKADAIILRSAPLSLVASLFLRAAGVKRLVIELNGWVADEARNMGVPGWLARLVGIAQRLEVPLAHAIRVVTPELARLAKEAGGRAIAIIPTGTRLDLFRPHPRAEARRALGYPIDDVRLAYLGNLWKAIDLETAIKAVALLRQRGVVVHLDIIGDGPKAPEFKALATSLLPADAFSFVGSVPPDQACLHIAAADLALAPFRPSQGGLSPLKLRDYAACGRLVVASDLPGVIPDGTQDWLFPALAGDVEHFATSIETGLALRSGEREQAARHYAEAHFGWDGVAQAIRAQLLTSGP